MLTFRFDPLIGEGHVVGPAPYFRIEGGELRAGPDDRTVAIYANGTWCANNRFFTVLSTDAPTRVRFEDEGESCAGAYGPFEQVQLVDGAIWHGTRLDGLLARLDDQAQEWYVYADQMRCPNVILEPAAG